MRLFRKLLAPIAGALVLGFPPGPACSETAPVFGVDLTAQDHSVRPQDDFFQYVNGAWLARTPIPPDQTTVSMSREEADRVERRLHELLESAAAKAPKRPRTVEQKVGAMYAAFMDEARIEALGDRPIRARLEAVRAAPSREAIGQLMGRSQYDFGGGFFSAAIDVDLKDPTRYAVYLGQSGLGMPDRDYYLQPAHTTEKSAYRSYVQRLLTLIGWQDPSASADAIVALETRIAEVSWPIADRRNLSKIYNPRTPAQLKALAPDFPWDAFLQGARLSHGPGLVLKEESAFPRIAVVFNQTPMPTLKAWLAFKVADGAAPDLAAPYQRAWFEFHDKALSGATEVQPRWKRAVAAVSGGDCDCFGTLDWAVGQMYVAHDFPPTTKAEMQALTARLISAFHARIEQASWMSPATKAEALRKLDSYTVKVGYPDRPRDYSRVEIRRDDLIGDVRRASGADWEFKVRRSRGPVDRTDWEMTPQTVDAYNGALRDIVFPAAVLQRTEFDPGGDDAFNYGAIGSLIGHELTHGFDDEGRKIDAAGVLRDWWTPQDAGAFASRAKALGAQYSAIEPVPGARINAELTMGENIADLGGLLIALDAYHASLGGKPAPILGGLTGDQRFFMAYAQSFRGKATEAAIRKLTASDPHSYRKYRVQVPVQNIDAWYDAFQVKAGDKLYLAPMSRARIW